VLCAFAGVANAEATGKLRALDKLNGEVEDLEVSVGRTLDYERLRVTLKACKNVRNGSRNDAMALLEIQVVREDTPRFVGWMIASSPALSALDHPRYDLWVLSCRTS
jgi:hypothetical protein